ESRFAMPAVPSDIKPLLEKKATFEQGVERLKDLLPTSGGSVVDDPAYSVLLARVHTLLQSRYNSTAFWARAQTLYRAALASDRSGNLATQLRGYLASCAAHLEDEPGTATLAAAPPPFSFQGLLSHAEPAAGPESSPQSAAALEALMAHLQQMQNGALGATVEGPEPHLLDADLLQALEDSMADVPRGAPPTSATVVQSLPKEVLTPSRLVELGGAGTRCPVCMEELEVEDTVQALPHELPTDDARYERERQEAEDQKGAANAVSHSEFMYL
ncbi:hypothetical protein APUTEX25_003007, partial [Auxenochlorella protothecoides]